MSGHFNYFAFLPSYSDVTEVPRPDISWAVGVQRPVDDIRRAHEDAARRAARELFGDSVRKAVIV